MATITTAQTGRPREWTRDDVIASARQDLEASRDYSRSRALVPLLAGLVDANGDIPPNVQFQPPRMGTGVTVDLCHKNLTALPEEVIDIIKDEIERLAISHNEVSEFPARLAECKRLRYLNARFNRLPDFPKPILQLTSLEILDLAKNRLRYIPEDIKNLTSLKVLAVQRNKIERLPVCLGEMTRLFMLKVEENPLVFPPYEICVSDTARTDSDRTLSQQEVMQITKRIKEWLVLNKSNERSAGTVATEDPDEDASEGNSETPRPARPMGRFPVRPSLGSADAVGASSTPSMSASPEPPPPVPNRNHERMRSTTSAPPRRQYFLSPPTTTTTIGPGIESGELAVRPKRHGMITPRGPEGVAQAAVLSPGALQEAFSGMGSRPPSRGGSAIQAAPQRVSADSYIIPGDTAYNKLSTVCKHANELRQVLDSQTTLRQHLEQELRSASNRSDILGRNLLRAKKDSGQPSPALPGFLKAPIKDCCLSIFTLARILSANTHLLVRQMPDDKYRDSFFGLQKDSWDTFSASAKVVSIGKLGGHSRGTSNSSQPQTRSSYHSAESSRSIPMTSIFDPRSQSRNGPSPSLMADQPLGTQYGSMFSPYNQFGGKPPYSKPVALLGPDGTYILREEDIRKEISYDSIWEVVYAALRDLCDRANDGLPKIQAYFNAERQRTARVAEPDSEMIRQLASLGSRNNILMDAALALNNRLESMRINDRNIRHDFEFWQLCRNIIVEWTGFVNKIKMFGNYSGNSQTEIKGIMKQIHGAVKDASARIQNSPWGHYLSQSNDDQSESVTLRNRPLPSAGIHASMGSMGAMLPPSMNQSSYYAGNGSIGGPSPNVTFGHTTGGSGGSITAPSGNGVPGPVPSTPLSAALGPAAMATLPNGRSQINFFERADRLAATIGKRGQPETLYTKKQQLGSQ